MKRIFIWLGVLVLVAASPLVTAFMGDDQQGAGMVLGFTIPKPAAAAEPEPGCDYVAVVAEALEEAGFDADLDFVWFDFDANLPGASDAGAGSFSSEPITDLTRLVEFLNDDSSESVAALEHLTRDLDETEVQRLLAGEGVVGVQFLTPIEADGNTLYTDDGLRPSSQTRNVDEGDIWWFFVDSDCQLVESATIRGTCANPQDELPKPKPSRSKPKQPEPPSKPSLLGPAGEQPCPNESGVYHPACQPVGPDPGPTEGYEAGNAEEVVEQQEQAAGSDKPSSHGQPADDSSGTPGSTTDPDGSKESGGDSGASEPEKTEGSGKDNEEEVSNPF